MAAGADELPLHRRVVISRFVRNLNILRGFMLFRLLLYVFFFRYRLSHRLEKESRLWLTALVCEIGLALYWILQQTMRLFPVERETYPDRMSARYDAGGKGTGLPAVDIFVTTADPHKEPPIITMNTVLSALAVDYPAEKVACYVSDDGGSWRTFWALVETARFAKTWLPFCKKFRIEPRAPKAYFRKSALKGEGCSQSEDFVDEFHAMKEDYRKFKLRLESVMHAHSVPDEILSLFEGRESEWPAKSVSDHPGILKVLLDPKLDRDSELNPLPYLFYVSREKRPDYKHHYKAGALNSLARISGIMTNSPFILNLDCDVYVNDSAAIRHAMCFFMDSTLQNQICFVQFPQGFDGIDDDDLYSNRLKSIYEIVIKGMDGVQGPCYCGSGCVHRRAALYGGPAKALELKEGDLDSKLKGLQDQSSFVSYEHLKNRFGRSSAFAWSAWVLNGGTAVNDAHRGMANVQEAMDLISCSYEERTKWGDEVGWIYGSCLEDCLTGMKEHCRGWRSIYCTPLRPTFVGCAPMTGPDALTWRKRASTGLLEILVGRHSPFVSGWHGLSFLQRIIYISWSYWTVASVFSFTYAILPAVCLLRGKSLIPKVSDPSFLLFALAFLAYYAGSFIENHLIGVSLKAWWNSEQMEAISNSSSVLFGVFEVSLKLLGLSETVFVVTPKREEEGGEEEEKQQQGKAAIAELATTTSSSSSSRSFVFNASPLFITPTALAIVNLIGLSAGLVRVARGGLQAMEELGGELWCAMWVVLLLQSMVKGLWMSMKSEKGEGEGIPPPTIAKATMLALFFCFVALTLF